MSKEKTVVTIATLYDLNKPEMETRSNFALQTMSEALERNCEVYVVDGGSTDYFVQKAKNLGARVFSQEGKGISRGQQQAISIARNDDADNYLLIEPEKAGLIRDHFCQIISPLEEGLADLVVVGRTDRSMTTLPPMQQYTERAINQIWKTLTGLDEDVLFASRAFNKDAAEFFLRYNVTRNWDLPQGARIDAMRAGLRIVPIKVDYTYPKEMVANEVGNLAFDKKRILQFQELTSFFEEYLK